MFLGVKNQPSFTIAPSPDLIDSNRGFVNNKNFEILTFCDIIWLEKRWPYQKILLYRG